MDQDDLIQCVKCGMMVKPIESTDKDCIFCHNSIGFTCGAFGKVFHKKADCPVLQKQMKRFQWDKPQPVDFTAGLKMCPHCTKECA